MGHALGAWEVRVDDPAHDAAGDSSAVLGRARRLAADVLVPAAMAVDSRGNVYTGEVDTGKRIQKFKLTSDALR